MNVVEKDDDVVDDGCVNLMEMMTMRNRSKKSTVMW